MSEFSFDALIDKIAMGNVNSKNSVKPIISLSDIVGKNLAYSSYLIKEPQGIDMLDETYKSLLLDSRGVWPSQAHFGYFSVKRLFEILNEQTTFRVINSNYSTGLSYPHSAAIAGCFGIDSEGLESSKFEPDFIIQISTFKCIKSSQVPEKYDDWLSSNDCLYLSTWSSVYYVNDKSEEAEVLINSIRDISLKNGLGDFRRPTVEVITVGSHGLDTREVEIDGNSLGDEALSLHYGDEFPAFNKALLKKMSKTSKGVALFHGEPGNGKTYYIRHLVSELRKANKRVIIVPKHVLAEMESPNFNDFMIDEFSDSKQQAVFVIEDAESVLRARDSEGDGRAVVSTILNLSDGLLNDIFKIQLICTFNTELNNIDKALLRPGRLIAKREFPLLDKKAASKLIESLGFEHEVKDKMTLAEIYALGSEEENEVLVNYKEKKPRIGF